MRKKGISLIMIIVILLVTILTITTAIFVINSIYNNSNNDKNIENDINNINSLNQENSNTEDFIFVVDDIFTIAVKGTAPTGKVIKGNIKVGDEVKIIQDDKIIPCRIKGIEKQKEEKESATEGEGVVIILGNNISRSEITRGQVITNSSNVKSANKFKAKLHMANEEEGFEEKILTNNSKILFDFYDTIKINSKIKFLDNINEAMPGDNLNAEVELENNVPIFKDANFNIVEGNTKYATLTVTEIN